MKISEELTYANKQPSKQQSSNIPFSHKNNYNHMAVQLLMENMQCSFPHTSFDMWISLPTISLITFESKCPTLSRGDWSTRILLTSHSIPRLLDWPQKTKQMVWSITPTVISVGHRPYSTRGENARSWSACASPRTPASGPLAKESLTTS